VERRRTHRAVVAASKAPPSPLALVMVFFGVLLATSVFYGLLSGFGLGGDDGSRLGAMLAVEVVDTLLVVAALRLVPRPPSWPAPDGVHPAWLWPAAVAALVGVVGINSAYHFVLRSYLGVQPERDPVVAAGVTPLVLVVYCIQPAIVEELFFRHLALDTLRAAISLPQAVAISSFMFGMAHVGVPLSVPMLALIGVPLALARVFSGGLALPMTLHFLHNLLVLWLE
jgi:membrane protease YdiL (CAAX protease family)